MVVVTHFNALNNVDCKTFMGSSEAQNTVHLDLQHVSDDGINIKSTFILCDVITTYSSKTVLASL